MMGDGRDSEVVWVVDNGGGESRGAGGRISGGTNRCEADGVGVVGAGSFGLGAETGDGLPVVFARLIGEPLRERHKEETAERFGVALIESAHLAKTLA